MRYRPSSSTARAGSSSGTSIGRYVTSLTISERSRHARRGSSAGGGVSRTRGSVGGGAGGVGAAGGESPAEDARLGLLDLPAGGLLRAMVGAALGAEVALVGGALWVGSGVVQVSVDGLGLTAGGGTSGGAGTDQVLELAARGVAVLGVLVVARRLGDRLEGDVQARAGGRRTARPAGRRGGPVAGGLVAPRVPGAVRETRDVVPGSSRGRRPCRRGR